MPLPSVRTVGRAVDVWVAVLRSWRFSEGDQPRCTPGRPSAWRPASSSPCTAFATCPAAMLRVIAAVARSTRGLRGGGRGATDLIAASAYWISARDQFALIFPLLPVADVKAGFKVSGCLSLIEGSDRSLWPRCCRSICRHRRPLRSGCGPPHRRTRRPQAVVQRLRSADGEAVRCSEGLNITSKIATPSLGLRFPWPCFEETLGTSRLDL